MKKILLMIALLSLFIYSDAQIMGPPNLIVGEESGYFINPPDPQYRVGWSSYGGIQITSRDFFSATVKAVSPGVGYLEASVYNSTGGLVGYYSTNIIVNPDPKAPPINGPTSTRVGKTYTYTIELAADFAIMDTWKYDKNYFDLVSLTATSITLKTKDKEGITYISLPLKEVSTHISMSSSKVISVTKPRYQIEASTSSVCSNEQIVYTLKDYESGDVVTWEAGNNLILISGQGTPKAIFKASGNGAGTVKATVTYEGKSYTVENSDVWIGAPLKPLITPVFSKFFAGSSYDVMITNVSPGSKVTWDISGATITSQTENSVLIKVANFDLDASVFIIATVENKCGTSRSSMSIPVKGLGGGGGVYPEI